MVYISFRAKIDAFFVFLIVVSIVIVGAVTLFPVLIEENMTTHERLTLSIVGLLSIGLIGWTAFFIEYRFGADHLFIKGGPFRSRIPYTSITKISYTNNIFTGYRVLSARHALQIYYRKAMLGSIKISPNDEGAFVSELKKRCPHLQT